MTNATELNVFDDIGKIRKLVQDTPPGPRKALEAEYEIALTMLAAYLPFGASANITKEEEKLARRLTRHFLFNYSIGFSLLKFKPPYNRRSDLSTRQRALEEAIQKLANLEPAREMMSEWFTAALEGRLHQTLREFLDAYELTLNPRLALGRTAARIGLSDDLEVMGRLSESTYKTVDFGVSGYYLLLESARAICEHEFQALLGYARRVLLEQQHENVPDLIEIARVFSLPALSLEQKDKLLRFVFSILDVEQFPLRQAEEEDIDPMADFDEAVRKNGIQLAIKGND